MITKTAVLAGVNRVPLQYSRVVRPWSSSEMIAMRPQGEPISFVVTFPAQNAPNIIWCEGRRLVREPTSPGAFSFYNFRQEWIVQVPNPIDSFHLWLPPQAFRDLEDAHRVKILENLHLDPTRECRDEVMLHLAASLTPSLSAPDEVTGLFAEHVFQAMRLHIAQTYGGLKPGPSIRRGSLTPLQERRVKEKLLDDLTADPGLSELAAICGLSVSHFARAFKEATGMPPHRWLLAQRVQRAKTLLASSRAAISEIALSCGFADQSHLTRVFSRAMGISPGAWRRQGRG
jgi:AraC-like DNA-binding protein